MLNQTLDAYTSNQVYKAILNFWLGYADCEPSTEDMVTDRDYLTALAKRCGSDSASQIIAAASIMALHSKNGSIKSNVNTKEVALTNFYACEKVCEETNRRLLLEPYGAFREIISIARRRIAACVGSVPSLATFKFAFGPGASVEIKGQHACIEYKLSSSLTCSTDLLQSELLLPLLEEVAPLCRSARMGFVEGNPPRRNTPLYPRRGKLSFVPKNSKTDRPIVVEPLLNGLFQKGVGSYLKKRLHKVGINLYDQTRNQFLARLGSLNRDLATLDLSSASDTICSQIVKILLPWDWFVLLSSLRTGTVEYQGSRIELEKFSSMGNGFTFELESLIFWGLSSAVCEVLGLSRENLSVFGDDIIVPSQAALLLSETLAHCGFKVNTEKSFMSPMDPFRESCGADWWNGFDVRPFFIREALSPKVLFLYHNWAIRKGYYDLAKVILPFIPEPVRLWGPDGYGDGHLLGQYKPSKRRKPSPFWEGHYFDTWLTRPKHLPKKVRLQLGDALLPAYTSYVRSSSERTHEPFQVRGATRYFRATVYTSAPLFMRGL